MMHTLSRHIRCALLSLLALVAVVHTAAAQAVFKSDQSTAELVLDRTAVAPGETLLVALKLDIIPGWHTYWRTPGDSGLPAEIRWNLPEGITAGPIQWPTPERIPYGDLMNFGYHDTVLLLTELRVNEQVPTGDIKLQAEASWLVCADICIPQDAAFSVPVTIGTGGAETASTSAIAATRAALPKPAAWPATATLRDGAVTLIAKPAVADKVTGAVFFPYDDGVISNAAPQELRLANNEVRLEIPTGEKAGTVNAINGLLVVQADGGSATSHEIAAPLTGTAASANADATAAMPLAAALLLAFLGGLILNVMPCVLPVLVMKAMSFISKGANDAAALRRDGLAYTAGVMVAFGVLVVALLALRAGSSAVGWGFQLQSPPFVATLAFIMLALGLSLSGVFTIGGSFGMGQSLTARGGTSGSFFTGLLAVVVATPCTAPFMGAALGFALTQTPAMTILIFEALALGLAFPYLVISFAPGVARRLPRPGVWMERVKQVLAFPLYGAAAWLLWVLSQQVDAAGFAVALAGVIFVGFAAWLWGTAPSASPRGQMWTKITAVASIAIALASIAALRGQSPAAQAAAQAAAPAANFEAYSETRLAELRAEGRPVFVNFTAAWCISCLVNERVALSRPEVVAALKGQNVAYLKGDWTNRNAEIAQALHKLGRDGVPLYVLYSPKGEAKILPQVLTPSLVVEALNAL